MCVPDTCSKISIPVPLYLTENQLIETSNEEMEDNITHLLRSRQNKSYTIIAYLQS